MEEEYDRRTPKLVGLTRRWAVCTTCGHYLAVNEHGEAKCNECRATYYVDVLDEREWPDGFPPPGPE